MHLFLMGLDKALYKTMRSNLLAQYSLLPSNRVYSKCVQDEQLKIVARETDECSEVRAFFVQAKAELPIYVI